MTHLPMTESPRPDLRPARENQIGRPPATGGDRIPVSGRTVRPFVGLAAAAGLCFATGVQAGLGEGVDSLQRDHAALRGAAMSVTPMAAFDLHEMTTAEGTRVREYVSHAGTVFAVTWAGRTPPDLSVVLAQHYQEFMKAAAAHRGNHKVFAMTTDTLVMSVMKLPRGFQGQAHVPSLLPAGVNASDIR
jgi:Protein of unknown function (DUF2844)